MASNRNIAIAFIATIAMLYGGAYLLGSRQDAASAPEPDNAARYFQAVREAEVKRTNGLGSDMSGTSNAEIARQFQSSRDYRALYESLRQSKADSAGLYAIHILSLCLDMQEIEFEATPPASERQREAHALMTGRCAAFTLDELRRERGVAMANYPRGQGAMLELKWRWDALKPDDRGRKALLETILRSREPLLLDGLGPALMAAESATSFRFKGRVIHSPPFARDVYIAAWTAATCEVSAAPCGAGDPIVVAACARGDACFSSRQALLRHQIAKSYGDDAITLYDSVLPELVSVIQEGDASALGP